MDENNHKGKLRANPIREYLISCFLCSKVDVIHYSCKSQAKRSFWKDGWRYRRRHWICPECIKQMKKL